LGGNIDLMEEKRTLTEGNIEANQQKYELNRKNNRDRILEERKMVEDNLKSRHDNVNEKNNEKFNNKIQEIKDRQNKYDKIFEEREKKQRKKKNGKYC
jgi:DNA repair exonuclease SbcCD ATPase subunit